MNSDITITTIQAALLAMQRHPWEQGLAMQAFMECGNVPVVMALAKEAAYRSMPDGRLAAIGTMEAITDSCAVGEALLFCAQKTGDKQLVQAQENLLHWALNTAPRNEAGIVYHMMDTQEFWVDSIYMLPPYLAASGYYQEALKQLYGYYSILYNSAKKLLSHRWDDKSQTFAREAFWGVGNGWALAALVRMIDLLPEDMTAQRNSLITMAKELIESTSHYINEDGLSHDVLDDPSTFLEVNFPQMLSYSIFRGIKSGWLENLWQPLAIRCKKAAEKRVDHDGFVQDVCGAPHFVSKGIAPEAQAFHILMQAAAQAVNVGNGE